MIWHVLHYLGAATACALAGWGLGLGQFFAHRGYTTATERHPGLASDIFKILFLGLLLIETCFIFALITSFIILFYHNGLISMTLSCAEFAAGIGMGIIATLACIAGGLVIEQACVAAARQPFSIAKIKMFMTLIMAIIETPLIFCFIITMFALLPHKADSFIATCKLSGGILAVSLGAIGPTLGQIFFAPTIFRAIGLSREELGKVLSYGLLTETMLETPFLLSFIVGLMIVFKPMNPLLPINESVLFLVIAFTIGMGTLGPCLGIGTVAAYSSDHIAIQPQSQKSMFRTSILSFIFIETGSIFCFVIALTTLLKICL